MHPQNALKMAHVQNTSATCFPKGDLEPLGKRKQVVKANRNSNFTDQKGPKTGSKDCTACNVQSAHCNAQTTEHASLQWADPGKPAIPSEAVGGPMPRTSGPMARLTHNGGTKTCSLKPVTFGPLALVSPANPL